MITLRLKFKSSISILMLLFLCLSQATMAAPKGVASDQLLEKSIEPLSDHLEKRGLNPEEFQAYVGADKGVYAYSDQHFCTYFQEDGFSVNDSITFGMASRVRDALSIPRGAVHCMTVSKK